MGEQAAFFVPNALFHGEPAHALHISAFNLALVHRWVDAAAHVVNDVHGFEPPLAGAGVDLHLGHRCAVAKVIKRLALQGLKVVLDFGRHVKPSDAQTHAVQPGLLGHFFPGHRRSALGRTGMGRMAVKPHLAGIAAQQTRRHRGQAATHLVTGIVDRCAIDIGAAGRGRGRGVGHFLGVGGGHAHAGDGDAQAIGGDLGHLGVQALAHFGAAVIDADRAIHVNADHSAALVQHGGGEADAKLQGHHGQAALALAVLGVEGIHRFAPGTIGGLDLELVEHFVANPVFDALAILGHQRRRVARDRRVAVQIDAAHIQRVFAQGVGDLLHHGLDAKHALRTAKPTESGGALHVGFAAVAHGLQMRDVVAVVDVQQSAVVDRARVVGAVAAA